MKETKKTTEISKITRNEYIFQCKQELDILRDIKDKWYSGLGVNTQALISHSAYYMIQLICQSISSDKKEF